MIINVPLDHVLDNPFQRRQDYGDVPGLAADIAANGLLQIPIGRLLDADGETVVMPHNLPAFSITDLFELRGCRVELAFGHRRKRAWAHLDAQGGGWTLMPVDVRPLDDDQMLNHVWSENQRRSDINAIEQAELLAEKLERARAAGGNQTTVAAEWGLDRSTIANKLRLLELPADVQTAVRERRLSERQALALLPVFELDAKLNGSPVQWGDTGGPTWHPRSPAGYVALVLTEPEKATSDAIRAYTQNAVAHAGRPLGDAFAAFEADQGRAIVQPACKGCPRRVNQHCLNAACYDARAKRFLAVLPEWASRETGLPFSDKAADETDYTHTYDEREALRADWKAGRHEGMVVGIQNDYYNLRPYTDKGYISEEAMMQDWRLALILGRKATTAPAAPRVDGATGLALPAIEDLSRWRKAQSKADRERTRRTKEVLFQRIRPLGEDETALRALMAMLDGWNLGEMADRGQFPTVEELLDNLFDKMWSRAYTTSYDASEAGNRVVLRRLLHLAAANPDLVDPPDRALMLLDIGQTALLGYEATRQRVDIGHAYARMARLRDALAEFEAAPHTVAGSEELEELARYLRAALEVEEAKLPNTDIN